MGDGSGLTSIATAGTAGLVLVGVVADTVAVDVTSAEGISTGLALAE